jgi:hypothetical protein
MANDYYTRQGSYTKGTLARGDVVKSDYDALVTAWDLGETNIKRALKLPEEGTPQTDWKITENATNRSGKVLGFDSSGDLELQTGVGNWEGTWATSYAYSLRDVVVDGAAGASTDNLYICIVAHTSGTWSTDLAAAKWELMVNVSEARDWARKTDGIVDSTDYSSKAWAVGGTDVTSTASRGAAKEWATTTGAAVDTSEYSAKEYAIGTTVAAGSAKTHADASSTSATASATSATASATSASASATSSTASAASATAASASETAAAGSATSAAADLATFQGQYHGAAATDPSTGLDDGDLYFNTTNNVMMVYDLGTTTWLRTTPTTTDQGHINTVSGIAANVTTVAGLSSEVTAVAGKSTEIGLLGVSAVITDMGILGTADVVADMNTLGSADVVADMNTLGTADVVSDMNVLATADVVTDMNTLGTADVVADMNTLGTADVVTDMNTLGTASNVTNMSTVAASIADVNRYANEYTISASAPGSPSAGDLWYDETNTVLKYYNGSSWAALSGDTDVLVGNSASDTTPGYLSAKVAAGNNVTLTTLNSGGNEQLQITATDNSAAMALALGG